MVAEIGHASEHGHDEQKEAQTDSTPSKSYSRRKSKANVTKLPDEAVKHGSAKVNAVDKTISTDSPKRTILKRTFTGNRHVSIETDDTEGTGKASKEHSPKARRKSLSAHFSPRKASNETVSSRLSQGSSPRRSSLESDIHSRRFSIETEDSDGENCSRSLRSSPRRSLIRRGDSSHSLNNKGSRRALRDGVGGKSMNTAMNAIRAIRIWKNEAATDGDENKRYRTAVARRMVYAKAKQYLDDTRNESRVQHIFKAVSVGARQVLLMGKVCDIYMCVIDEMRIRQKMTNLAKTLFAMADWKTFLADLKLVRNDIQSAIDRHRDMIEVDKEQSMITTMSKMIELHYRVGARLNQRSGKLSQVYDQLVSQKGKKKEGKVEKVWDTIVVAKREIQDIEHCTRDLQCAVSMLGRLEARESEGLGQTIDLESQEMERKDDETLSVLPEREMATLLDGFVQCGSDDDSEAAEISRGHLESLGFDEEGMNECINAMRRIAWRKLVAGSVQVIQGEYHDAIGILKIQVERLEAELTEHHGAVPAKAAEKIAQYVRKSEYGNVQTIFRKTRTKVYTQEEIDRMIFNHEHPTEFGTRWLEEVSNKIHSINNEECVTEEEEIRRRSSLLYIHSDVLREAIRPVARSRAKSAAASSSSDDESGLADSISVASSVHEQPVEESVGPLSNEDVNSTEIHPDVASRNPLQSPHPMHRVPKVKAALGDLTVALHERWGSIDQAIASLTQHQEDSRLGEDATEPLPMAADRVSLRRVHSELLPYLPRSIVFSIICLLFQCLGISRNEDDEVSLDDFRNMMNSQLCYDSESTKARYFEKMFRALVVRDALLSSMHGPDTLLTRVQLATHGVTIASTSDTSRGPSHVETLTAALNACFQALLAKECRVVAASILSPSGIRIILNVIAAIGIATELRIVAVFVIADAIECHAGPAYKSIFKYERARDEEEIVPPPRFDTFLAVEIWRPVLDIIDPEGVVGPPPLLAQELVDALFCLLRQIRVPGQIFYSSSMSLVADVCSSLKQLRASPLDAEVLLHSLRSFRILEDGHEQQEFGLASDVHMVAAAFGGCRFLREQLALMQGVEGDASSKFFAQGDNMLRLWRGARQRLFAKLQSFPLKPLEGKRFDMLEKILEATVAEGYKVVSFNETYEYTKAEKIECPHAVENEDIDPLFAPDSMELNLWHRLVNRWEAAKAQEEHTVSAYDWDRPETVSLAEALCESRIYLSRGPVPPALRMPPRLVKPRNRSPKSSRSLKQTPLPLLSPLTPRTQTSFETLASTNSPARGSVTYISLTHPALDGEAPVTRAQTAGGTSRYRQLPWVIEDTSSQQRSRPSTQNSPLRRNVLSHGALGHPLLASPRHDQSSRFVSLATSSLM